MSLADAIIPAAAKVIGSGLEFIGVHQAASQQADESAANLAFAREQAAQQQRNYEQQQAALQAQWAAREKALAPYRAAASSIFAKYGIGTPSRPSTMPAGYTGATAAPSAPSSSTASLASLGGMKPWQPYAAPAYTSPVPAGMPMEGNVPGGPLTLADLGMAFGQGAQ